MTFCLLGLENCRVCMRENDFVDVEKVFLQFSSNLGQYGPHVHKRLVLEKSFHKIVEHW